MAVWTPARGGVLRLCILGRDPFGGGLEGLDGRQVQGARCACVRWTTLSRPRIAILVFVSGSEERRMGLILRGLAGRGC